MEALAQDRYPVFFFSGQSRATVTLFLAVWNGIARSSALLLKSVQGRCGAFTPLGKVAENLEGVEAREGRRGAPPRG